MFCSGGGEEAEAGGGTAIYNKKGSVGAVDTVGPAVETEMVKLNDTLPEAAVDDANNVSNVYA